MVIISKPGGRHEANVLLAISVVALTRCIASAFPAEAETPALSRDASPGCRARPAAETPDASRKMATRTCETAAASSNSRRRNPSDQQLHGFPGRWIRRRKCGRWWFRRSDRLVRGSSGFGGGLAHSAPVGPIHLLASRSIRGAGGGILQLQHSIRTGPSLEVHGEWP